MAIPEIFTSTPIEGHIIALCTKVQVQFASFMMGTPVIKGAFFVALGIVIIVNVSRMGLGKASPGSCVWKIVWHLALIIIAMTFLGKSSGRLSFKSSGDGREWAAKSKIRNNANFSATLNAGSAEGLHWYVMIHRAVTGFSDVLTDKIAATFNDPSLKSDSTFMAKQLAKTGVAALGKQGAKAASLLDALARDCSNTQAGKIVGRLDSVRELFETSTTDCALLWTQFQAELTVVGNDLKSRYSSDVMSSLQASFATKHPGVDPDKAITNIAIANAIVNYARSRAGFTDPRGSGGSDELIAGKLGYNYDQTKNSAATFSSYGDRVLEDVSEGPISRTFGYVVDMFYNIAGSDYHTKSLKAEAAAKFNQFAALLPPARGWIHGILAILFVLAVASLGFGSIRFMQAWLLALATISFYKPVAVLGYKMAEYFTTNSEYLEAVTKIQNDPLLLGGARIIQDQLAQIQTVYLCFEIGAFAVFVAGAIGCFRALTNMTNSVAGTVSHHSTALLMKGYHLATGAVGGIAAGPAVMSGATGVGMGTAQQQPNVFVNVSHGATHWNQANDSFTSPTTPSHWQGGAFGKGSQI